MTSHDPQDMPPDPAPAPHGRDRLIAWVLPSLAAVLVIALMRLHLPWAAANPAPHGRDEPLHLRNALVVAETIAASPGDAVSIALGDFPVAIRDAVYPPLTYVLPAPVKIVADRYTDDVLASLIAMTVFALILSLSVYFAGKRLAGGGTIGGLFGLAASAVVVLSPIVIDQSHHFSPNLPATAMVALGLCLFLASEDFSRPGFAIAFAAVCGLGMLTYYTVFLFIAGPVLVSLVKPVRPTDESRRGRYLAWLLIAVAIAVVLCVPFYLRSGIVTKLQGYWNLFFGGVRPVAEESDLPANASFLAALFYYPRVFFTAQAGVVPGILLTLGVLTAFLRKTHGRWHLLLGVLIPWAAFTLFNSKWPERTMPALPIFVLLAMTGFAAMRTRVAAGLLVMVMVVLSSIPPGVQKSLAEKDELMRTGEVTFRAFQQPFVELKQRRDPGAGPALVAVAHNRMLFEYVAERVDLPCRVVQAKTDADFFTRFDDVDLAVMIAGEPGEPDWFDEDYLVKIASLRSDLGPVDTARRLAERVTGARGEFDEVLSATMRRADFHFYLRRNPSDPETTEPVAP